MGDKATKYHIQIATDRNFLSNGERKKTLDKHGSVSERQSGPTKALEFLP